MTKLASNEYVFFFVLCRLGEREGEGVSVLCIVLFFRKRGILAKLLFWDWIIQGFNISFEYLYTRRRKITNMTSIVPIHDCTDEGGFNRIRTRI